MFLVYVLAILYLLSLFWSVLFLQKICCKVASYICCLQRLLIVLFSPVLNLISCCFVCDGPSVFAQWQNCLMTHFSGHIPIMKRRMTVCITCTHGFNYHLYAKDTQTSAQQSGCWATSTAWLTSAFGCLPGPPESSVPAGSPPALQPRGWQEASASIWMPNLGNGGRFWHFPLALLCTHHQVLLIFLSKLILCCIFYLHCHHSYLVCTPRDLLAWLTLLI